MSIIGKRWKSPKNSQYNIVYWEIKEQGKTGYGIPDELRVAILVHHGGPFKASVEVKADTPVKNGLFSFTHGLKMSLPSAILESQKATNLRCLTSTN